MPFPHWYEQDDDGGLVLTARVTLPGEYGVVHLRDATERSRRKVQEAARDILSGVSVEEARSGKVSASAVDLGKLAALSQAKLVAYVEEWDHGLIFKGVQASSEDWGRILDLAHSKIIDRIVLGIDYFTGAATPDPEPEGNVPAPSSEPKPLTSSSGPMHLRTDDTSPSSLTSSTRAEPGSSPPVEICAISPPASRKRIAMSS